MRIDEELIAEHNVQIIASALLDVIDVFNKICDCENKYIIDLGNYHTS